jgi:hypothetical protein
MQELASSSSEQILFSIDIVRTQVRSVTFIMLGFFVSASAIAIAKMGGCPVPRNMRLFTLSLMILGTITLFLGALQISDVISKSQILHKARKLTTTPSPESSPTSGTSQ